MPEPKVERRTITGELRAQGDEFAIAGYAALFNTLSKDLGGFREIIRKGAFARSLNGADVSCLFNHEPSRILGRVSAGTLKVEEDDSGLFYRCQLDRSNQSHQDLYASIKRGDISECSFAFTVPAGGDSFTEATDDQGKRFVRRELLDVNLLDVSPVTYPAYPGTQVGARSVDYSTVPTAEENRARYNRILDQENRARLANVTAQMNTNQTAVETRASHNEWFAEKCSAACREMGLEYCSHDDQYVYAADPDDDNDDECVRFGYKCAGDGSPVIDKKSRAKVAHKVSHELQSDRALRRRMQVAAGRR